MTIHHRRRFVAVVGIALVVVAVALVLRVAFPLAGDLQQNRPFERAGSEQTVVDSARSDPAERPSRLDPSARDDVVGRRFARTPEPASNAVEGIVVDRDGRPIPGARIRVHTKTFESGVAWINPIVGSPCAVTGDDGRFRVLAAPTDPFVISAQGRGRPADTSAILETIPGQDLDVRIVLDDGLSIEGTVRDERGNGVEGVSLWATYEPRAEDRNGAVTTAEGVRMWPTHDDASVQSDVTGAFRLEGLRPGDYEVHARSRTDDVRVVVEAGTTGLEIQVRGAGSVRGRIVAAPGGEPIDAVNMDVRLIWLPQTTRYFEQSQGDIFGGAVEFRLDDVVPGWYRVLVRSEGFVPTELPAVEVRAFEETFVTVPLRRGGSIVGTVRSAKGAVAGAEILVRPYWDFDSSDELDSSADWIGVPEVTRTHAVTGLEGRFRVDGITRGRYEVYVTHPTLVQPSIDRVVVETGLATRPLSILLSAGGAIVGTAFDGEGAPIPEAKVGAIGPLSHDQPLEAVVADANGRYRFERLPPGDYALAIVSSSQRLKSVYESWHANADVVPGARVVVTEGATIYCDLVELPTATLRGTVRRGDAPVGGMVELFYEGSTHGPNSVVNCDRYGRYEFKNLVAGDYAIRVAVMTGGREIYRAHVTVVGGDDIEHDIDLPTAVVEGVVVSGRDGRPVANALVELQEIGFRLPFDGDPRRWTDDRYDERSDAEGRFRFYTVRPGSYRLTALAPDFGEGLIESLVIDRAGVSDLELVLPEGGSLRIAVLDSVDGLPIAASMQVLDSRGNPAGRRSRLRSETGTTSAIVWKGLAPGEYRIRCRATGHDDGEATVRVRAGEQTEDSIALLRRDP